MEFNVRHENKRFCVARGRGQEEAPVEDKNADQGENHDTFIQLLLSAKQKKKPFFHVKSSKETWISQTENGRALRALESRAVNSILMDDCQKNTAGKILRAMGIEDTPFEATKLLIDVGYFPPHVNLDLLRSGICSDHSDALNSAAETLLASSPEFCHRDDLTHLKAYMIDVDEADELDDAVSAARLDDGRIKVWIHVADPTRLVRPGSLLDREAMSRGSSVFLPTATYPMFPLRLAMEGMSLKKGRPCDAVTVSATLRPDGTVAEYGIRKSRIVPSHLLTYATASDLLRLGLEEETDLKLLHDAAACRLAWRVRQGAVDTPCFDPRVKVSGLDAPEPTIRVYLEDGSGPSCRIVSEMMILCGELVAAYGGHHGIPLPYRGHSPIGSVLAFEKPTRHSALGLPGYVQFTSPIRRYIDLISHYQVAASLVGERPPFSPAEVELMAMSVNVSARTVKRVSLSALRYWIIELLRRASPGQKFRSSVLKLEPDGTATVLLKQFGWKASALAVPTCLRVGDELDLLVQKADPRSGVLSLKPV